MHDGPEDGMVGAPRERNGDHGAQAKAPKQTHVVVLFKFGS